MVRWIGYLTLGSNFPISSFCYLCSSYSKFLELNLLTTTTHFFIPVRNSYVFHTFWNPSPCANHSLYLSITFCSSLSALPMPSFSFLFSFLMLLGFFIVNFHIFRPPLTLPEKYIVYMFHARYSLNILKDISFRENVQSSLKGIELNYHQSDAIWTPARSFYKWTLKEKNW